MIPRGVRATLTVRVCSEHPTAHPRKASMTGPSQEQAQVAGQVPGLGCLHWGTPHPLSLVSWGVVGILDPFLGGKLYCKCLRQVPAHTQLTQKELL